MKRIVLAAACAVAAAAIGTALASAFAGKSGLYGLSPPSAKTRGSTGSLFALEIGALTRQGIPHARAYQAIGVQSTIAESGLARKIETGMADTYGGIWFEPATAQLHIGVTSPASRRTAEAIVARAGLTASVTMTPVRSTWAQLLAAQKQWLRKLADLSAHHEVTTALVARSNAVSVMLSSSVPPPERASLEREALTAAVNVTVSLVPSAQLTITPLSGVTECNMFKTEAAFCNKTLTSGVTIRSAWKNEGGGVFTQGVCTDGPMVISSLNRKETYMLTAGHCIEGRATPWYAYNRAGESKEIGTENTFVNGKNDIGWIKINKSGYWVGSNAENPVDAATAEWTKKSETSYPVSGEREPMEGNTDCHEGQTTGESCGTIRKVVVSGTEEYVEVEGAVGAKGDSGGPWLFITTKSNEALMEGTLRGEIGKNLAYQPLRSVAKIFTELKTVEVLTTANEKR